MPDALSDYAGELEALARLPVRLSSRNPEHPHEDVSELRGLLFNLAARMRRGIPSLPIEEQRHRGKIEPGTIRVEGRFVRVEVRRKKAA